MDHRDHVSLLAPAVRPDEGGVWADLGAGSGAFTFALAELIGTHGVIHAIDRDRGALAELRASAVSFLPMAEIRTLVGDFTKRLDLGNLDGVVMANALHFVEEKLPVLARVHRYLKRDGRLLLVEYDSDRGNPWVPHPISYETWTRMAEDAGFRDTRRLASVPSRFLRSIYSAMSFV